MEIIYPTGSDASNINVTSQKRLFRVVQGQTQATPTSGYLDPSLRNTTGGIRVPGVRIQKEKHPQGTQPQFRLPGKT